MYNFKDKRISKFNDFDNAIIWIKITTFFKPCVSIIL